MSFFGFATSGLEEEKKKFLESGLQESEDLAVYTWGDDSYDGLGDVLVEGGDELNDETFGGVGEVGKDFDFTKQTLPDVIGGKDEKRIVAQEPLGQQTPLQDSSQLASKPAHAGVSIWDDNSPFSALPLSRTNGTSRPTDHQRTFSVSSRTTLPSHAFVDHSLHDQQIHPRSQSPASVPRPISRGVTQTGARTLQEIEAEMRLAAQQARQRQELELRQQLQLQRERELRLAEQEQQQERLLMQQLQQQQQHELQLRLSQHQHPFQQQSTPPPRMVHHAHAQLPRTQSPRFHHQHQQQILMLQQEQERQQQERLKELQERLRMEEIERQLRAQSISHIQRQPSAQARRQTSYADLQALQQRRTHSPATHLGGNSVETPLMNQQNAQFLPQNIQLQQRLLSEMAQAEFMRDVQGISQVEQEALRAEAMRKIMETERMEEKRRRKAAKIAHMSRYNDLMTQSDKDFITRIQVSQLVTQDPYADDFYAQVSGDERVLKFGSSGGVGLGLGQKVPGRRQSAMQKMEAQVERIVNNARLREKEKGLHSLQSLQGALGKTAGRSYKAAPRQLLQVDAGTTTSTVSSTHPHLSKDDVQSDTRHSLGDSDGAAREAAKMGREALGDAAGADGVVRKDPLTHRQVLVALESLYDLVLSVEQLRRDQPPEDDPIAFAAWSRSYDDLVEQIWVGLKVMIPLETSDPHPFISLLTPIKGKKLLPRLSRHIAAHRMPMLLTLLVACFSQLDVVARAYILDTREDSPERQEVERQTAAFLGSVLQSILPVVARAELRLVTGLLGLLLDQSDIIQVAQTRPGIAMLTLFLSRVEIIKQGTSTAVEMTDLPTPEEAQQWQLVFDHFFQLLVPYFPMMFPSTRFALLPAHAATETTAVHQTDLLDQPVWQFLAAVALHAAPDQQSTLVAGLRDKVLENVASVQKERSTKLANVNLFLHALGLDSSQITI
ncbi:topoisomerase II-associated protein PAT1 [Pisolithus albus]|nr:topoisomerase II-associated protein PAT1 [Pisolithus albus]